MTEEAGLIHEEKFVSKSERVELVRWLETIHPLWEMRHPLHRGLRQGQKRRRLLRPVYWLGGWQFACQNYFHPPDHVEDRVLQAEPFPPALSRLVERIEAQVRATFSEADCPPEWQLNTCLINFYGLTKLEGRWVDTGRVGGHRDYEPGPVASLSLGARARFQFASKARGPIDEDVVLEQPLNDRSLLVFGTPRWKDGVFHRVPEVARQDEYKFEIPVEGFRIRRVNFTLRYVPREHLVPFAALGEEAHENVRDYVKTLSEHAPFFAAALATRPTG